MIGEVLKDRIRILVAKKQYLKHLFSLYIPL